MSPSHRDGAPTPPPRGDPEMCATPELSGFFFVMLMLGPAIPFTFVPHIPELVFGAWNVSALRSDFWMMSFGTCFLQPVIVNAPRIAAAKTTLRMAPSATSDRTPSGSTAHQED